MVYLKIASFVFGLIMFLSGVGCVMSILAAGYTTGSVASSIWGLKIAVALGVTSAASWLICMATGKLADRLEDL